MCDIDFNQEEFTSVIDELVPSYNRKVVMDALLSNVLLESDLESLGLSLTGEQRNIGFIIQTSAQAKSEKSMWQAIKSEVYDFLCTNSKRYASERAEGGLTIKT
jgi:hypothetical protein